MLRIEPFSPLRFTMLHLSPIQAKTMFGLFKKDPIKKLEKEYQKLLEEAMQLQRGGDIKGYSQKMAEAEEKQKEMERLQEEKK